MHGNDAGSERRAEREEMVRTQLVRRGIHSQRVLDAMRKVPRELFVPASIASKAYRDAALPVDCEQTISQPFIVARMTELLELNATDRVLEIGTGTGYQTAVLAELCREVYSVEWHLMLMTVAADRLQRLDYTNVRYRCADGSLGWPAHAPYDAIMVTAGAPGVPTPLQEQLVVGGRLVIPIGPLANQILVRVRRTASGYEREDYLSCRFVKLLGEKGWSD